MMTRRETAKLYKHAIIDEFDGFLKDLHFKKIRHQTYDDGFSIIYRCKERYILFRGNLHFRDFPYSYDITIGEGSHNFPEGDWNSTSLWRMIRNKNEGDFERYELVSSINPDDTTSQIADKIRESHILLEKYGRGFLNNDLAEFQAVRADQNKDREPYKIYFPSENGKYDVKYEETGSKLKEKYSK